MAKLYEKIILQHYTQPLNKNTLSRPTITLHGANYFCGDEITFYLKLNKRNTITSVGWQGKGCAISQASASLFSELIKGKNLKTIQKLTGKYLLKKLNIELSPTRIKCAVLPLYIIKGQNINEE